MWYAMLLVIALADGDVMSFVAQNEDGSALAFATEQACKEFLASHEKQLEAAKKTYSVAQVCVRPEGGQEL